MNTSEISIAFLNKTFYISLVYPNSGKNGHFYLEKIKRAFKEGPIFVSLKAVSIKPFILTQRSVYIYEIDVCMQVYPQNAQHSAFRLSVGRN